MEEQDISREFSIAVPASGRCVLRLNVAKNKGWGANKLEAIVWAKLEEYLRTPDLIKTELAKQRQDVENLGIYETELQQIERQLKAV